MKPIKLFSKKKKINIDGIEYKFKVDFILDFDKNKYKDKILRPFCVESEYFGAECTKLSDAIKYYLYIPKSESIRYSFPFWVKEDKHNDTAIRS